MDYGIIFGVNLKRLAKEARITYKEVGMAVNRKGGAVQQWAGGMSQPNHNIIVGLAEFFSEKLGKYVAIDEFYDRKPK